MSDLAKVGLYCDEARNIIARAEETFLCLNEGGACLGHKLMAAQNFAALKRLGQIIDRHDCLISSRSPINAVEIPVVIKRRWWAIVLRRNKGNDRTFETPTSAAFIPSEIETHWNSSTMTGSDK